jgi:hypothetical protein
MLIATTHPSGPITHAIGLFVTEPAPAINTIYSILSAIHYVYVEEIERHMLPDVAARQLDLYLATPLDLTYANSWLEHVKPLMKMLQNSGHAKLIDISCDKVVKHIQCACKKDGRNTLLPYTTGAVRPDQFDSWIHTARAEIVFVIEQSTMKAIAAPAVTQQSGKAKPKSKADKQGGGKADAHTRKPGADKRDKPKSGNADQSDQKRDAKQPGSGNAKQNGNPERKSDERHQRKSSLQLDKPSKDSPRREPSRDQRRDRSNERRDRSSDRRTPSST